MFKYIGYDLEKDSLLATNDYEEWYYTLGNAPQRTKYFSNIDEAIEWIKNHPDAHKNYIDDLKAYMKFIDL